ncbi:MAG: 2-oxo acid dehydrogenase subunit E2 [Phycisphaerales bacterium]|nr:MAG: 2-oxo acid dehydrogenase subunit E2 [Phycisphaerales bacterium]
MSKTFKLPDLGEGIHEAQVIRVMIRPGEQVTEDQPLMEVETDKAAVEIPSPFSGTAVEVHVSEGQTISVGDVVVTFDGVGGAAAESRPAGAAAPAETKGDLAPRQPRRAEARAETPAPAKVQSQERTKVPAAPAVRKLARELGIDINEVSGSGPGGRVTREDVEAHAAGGAGASATAPTSAAKAPLTPSPAAAAVAPAVSRIAPMPAAPPPGEPGSDKYGPIRTWPMTQIRKTIARQMRTSAFTIPHVTHCDEADITELERVRRKLNEATGGNPKLSVTAFVMRAACIALRKFPGFNAVIDEEGGTITYKEYINLGMAVDTDRGLMVPNIRNADTLSLTGLMQALEAAAAAARANKLSIEEMRGGTFTITNVGPLGGTVSTPIINHPEVAILGLGRVRRIPVFDENDQVKPALLLPLFVSFDHRAIDGVTAAKFTREVVAMLEIPALMLLY